MIEASRKLKLSARGVFWPIFIILSVGVLLLHYAPLVTAFVRDLIDPQPSRIEPSN